MPTGPRRDILLDDSGERVLVAGDYGFAIDEQAIRQGIACRARLYLGEYWLDQGLGVPYLQSVLVKNPNPIVVKAEIGRNIALTPDVINVVAVAYAVDGRTRGGSITYTCNSTLGAVTGTVTAAAG